MSRIKNAFKNGKAFIAFVTCGDPDIETTKKVILEAEKNGADLIEIGIPFSDPTAEGPVIQEANIRALSGGMTTDKAFGMVKELRHDTEMPLVFMTYANVVFSYGVGRFMENCQKSGIDGIIIPDLPFEEKSEFLPECEKYGIELISMIAPTSMDRISMIAKEAKGFVYLVSSLGVTGTRSKIDTDIKAIVDEIRKNTDTPVAVGFGISDPEMCRKMSDLSDGAIVGSAIMKLIAGHGKDSPAYVGEFVKSMTSAMS